MRGGAAPNEAFAPPGDHRGLKSSEGGGQNQDMGVDRKWLGGQIEDIQGSTKKDQGSKKRYRGSKKRHARR